MGGTYDPIIERLAALEEEIGDLAYDRLRALAADPDGDGAATVKAEERRLLQARRAISKAINALRDRD